MTFPCKEEFIVFEKLARRQVQIYPDSCDYGIPIKSIRDIAALRRTLVEMIKCFKHDRDYKTRVWGTGRSVEMFIPIEIDDGEEVGINFKVAFEKLKGGFITIDINRAARPWNLT